VLLAAAQASIPAHSYSPREVKCSVAGYGAASKQQMQQMVTSALGLTEYPEPADAADALAVAMCHGHAARAAERTAAAMRPRTIVAALGGVRLGEAHSPIPRKPSSSNRVRAVRVSEL
jgi:hypothetical protein